MTAAAFSACQPASDQAPQATPHASHAPAAASTPRVPAYHADPEKARPFPLTLDPAQFSASYAKRAYQIAKDIPEVLAQQPCYCYCDSGFGHDSLLECHIDDHSAG
ncbi:MAG: hypothetical protein KF868_01885 [Acidobacteria bacterium]|nr:hypothetical protein [Acidobacteriota bacterium]